MAVMVGATNVQMLEFDVTTAEGPGRVTVVTGMMPVIVQASSQTVSTQDTARQSYKTLVAPKLLPGQFRKATATASLAFLQNAPGPPPYVTSWQIEDAQATFDDETGLVQLIVDVMVYAAGAATQAQVYAIMFQVTTLARL
jgi:hypothetical protein